MQAIHFGAGKIGRSFIGAVLRKAGYELCFADVDQETIDLINRERQYTIHVLDLAPYDERIEDVSAVHTSSAALLSKFETADVVTTAVSMKVLPLIAPRIAEGILRRMDSQNPAPVNIMCCENGIRATSQLKAMVYEHLSAEGRAWADRHVGFADSSVDRIVPLSAYEHPLDVATEAFFEWNIDRSQLRGTLPTSPGMRLTDNLTAHIERKLFTVNTGHCATAFLGNIKGYTYIHECMDDKDVRQTTRAIMQQSGRALIASYGFAPGDHEEYIERRFSNPHIKDQTARVGHDPRRKLGPMLYFSHPVTMALKHRLPTDMLCLAIAAGMTEKIEGDPQCDEIEQLVRQKGPAQAAREITGQTDTLVIQQITDAYNTLNT